MSDDIKLPELPDFDLEGVRVDGFSIEALEDYAREAVELNRSWLPIESAPKDGSPVMLWLGAPYSERAFAYWYEPWGNWQPIGHVPEDTYELTGIGSKVPTHWMPLPPPPEID